MVAAGHVLRLLSPSDLKDAVVDELYAFRESLPPFHEIGDTGQSNLPPFAWWDLYGAVGKYIAPIAKRIFSSTVVFFFMQCRNWRSYSFVYDK